ncbi:alpha/beta fold hydrolase [Natrarchaeobius oligotrophus]|uniref:Alpha/beta hydrolase n=1 Tax=Natrarchaeobius chitinivorans TaxID=1679083 RepID=A0A3N6M969_NATCH|nr:alpha/beta hydrolase [Natrarchaeobius chitinivorans]RQG98947.1 alpha/beta hydrolase [Natrarchaeobius chitinivorans]
MTCDARYWGKPKTLTRRGSLLHYWVCGPNDAPLVVLTHGASMDHRLFDAQLGALLEAGYRVLGWDVRGHGYSKPIGSACRVPVVVEDLIAILDRLEASEVVVVGQSFGGYVSQELLFRYPDRVTAICVVGATDLTQLPSRLEYVALRLSPSLFRIWPDRHLRRLVADRTAETESAKRYAHAATCQLSKREFVAVWKAVATALHAEPGYVIDRPLLLVHGEHDATGTIARDAPSWADRVPNCRYEVIPNAGHNANQDNPEAFNRVLLEFLDLHAPTR